MPVTKWTYTKYFTCINLTNSHKVSAIIIPILQIRKQAQKEVLDKCGKITQLLKSRTVIWTGN